MSLGIFLPLLPMHPLASSGDLPASACTHSPAVGILLPLLPPTHSPAVGLQNHTTMHTFCMGAEDPNSDPHAAWQFYLSQVSRPYGGF